MRSLRVGLLAGSQFVIAIATFAIGGLFLAPSLSGAIVQGVVVESASGRPLARSQVSLEGDRIQRSAVADAQGRFTFPDLPAGAYRLSATRKGYALARYGQTTWSGAGSSILVGADHQFQAQLKLHRLGVLTGQIRDENGVGIPDFPVYAYRAAQRLKLAAMTQTDDRGVFRLSGLEPGRYYVRSGAQEVEARRGLLPTYLGQVTRLSEAKVLRVDLEQDVAAGTIEPIAGRLSSLIVQLQGPAGVPVRVTLFTDMGKKDAQADAGGGTVRFDQLAPGSYDIVAEGQSGASAIGAAGHWEIGKEVEQQSLTLSAAPSLRVRCEELSGKDLPSAGVGVFLRRPHYAEDATAQRVGCGEQIPLGPGEWELGVLAPPQLYLAQTANLARGPEGFRLTLASRQAREIGLVFSADPAILKGKVVTDDGAPAIGAPVFVRGITEELQNRLGGVRTARTNQDGEFEMPGLPPGQYEATSTYEVQDTSEIVWGNSASTSFSLESGKKQSVQVTLQRSAS